MRPCRRAAVAAVLLLALAGAIAYRVLDERSRRAAERAASEKYERERRAVDGFQADMDDRRAGR